MRIFSFDRSNNNATKGEVISLGVWEEFFLEKHIDDVLQTGCFTGYEFKKEIEQSEDTVLYAAEYHCQSMEFLNTYNERFAKELKEDVLKRFSGKFTAQRSVFTVLGREGN